MGTLNSRGTCIVINAYKYAFKNKQNWDIQSTQDITILCNSLSEKTVVVKKET